MGVSDYLVRPVKTEDLTEIIAKTLIEKLGVSKSSLIATIGAKGGVGTTSLTQAIAWILAKNLNQKTILCDFSAGWSTLPVGMGFEPAANLPEALRALENDDNDSFNRMLFHADENLVVLSIGNDSMLDEPVEADQLEAFVDALMNKYPVVLTDLSGSTPRLQRMVLSKANHIGLMTCPTVACLRLVRSLIQEIKDIRGGSEENLSLFVNMKNIEPGSELKETDIEEAIGVKPHASIPFLPKTFISIESDDQNILQDKQGKELVEKAFTPFLQSALQIEEGQKDIKITSADKADSLFGGLFKLGKKK